MKHLAAIAFLLMVLTSKAQTVTSIADGSWDDPATWDCACVPVAPAEVQVFHHVTSPQANFQMNMEVHVFSGGLLDLSSAHVSGITSVPKTIDQGGLMLVRSASFRELVVNGSLVASLSIYLSGNPAATIGGTVSTQAVLCYGGDIVLNSGSIMVSIGLTMAGSGNSISGAGQICANDSIGLYNCTVSGTVDLCDLSSTTVVPPFVSVCYNCTAAPTVTYCNGSSCMASVQDVASIAALVVYPNPAHDHVTFEGMPAGVELRIYDGLGQLVLLPSVASGAKMTVDLGGLPKGIYLATATKEMLRLTTPLLVE